MYALDAKSDLEHDLFVLRPSMLRILTPNRDVNFRGIAAILDGRGIDYTERGKDIVAFDREEDCAYTIRTTDAMITETVLPPEYIDEDGYYQELSGRMCAE